MRAQLYPIRGRIRQSLGNELPGTTPISKSYLLAYPDGSKKHIRTAERDELLLSGLAREIAPCKFLFIGQQRTMHSLAELGTIDFGRASGNLRRFLRGSFIFEFKGQRIRELMETPESLAMRMNEPAVATA